MKNLKKYRFFFILLSGLLLIAILNQSIAIKAVQLTGNSMIDMLFLLPPIFILVGLLDQWVKKDTLIRYMGEKSGIYGLFFTLLLATIAAGPLYIAFPIAVLLLKKGASVRYLVFFLGAWSTVKLPVLIYEFTSFGLEFTLIHICFGLTFYYVTGLLFEKYYDQKRLLKHDIAS
ncbi:permease [Actinomycetes bacterium NPDC127524]